MVQMFSRRYKFSKLGNPFWFVFLCVFFVTQAALCEELPIPRITPSHVYQKTEELRLTIEALGLLDKDVHKAAEILEYAGKDIKEAGARDLEALSGHYEALAQAVSNVEENLCSELEKARGYF